RGVARTIRSHESGRSLSQPPSGSWPTHLPRECPWPPDPANVSLAGSGGRPSGNGNRPPAEYGRTSGRTRPEAFPIQGGRRRWSPGHELPPASTTPPWPPAGGSGGAQVVFLALRPVERPPSGLRPPPPRGGRGDFAG